VVNESDGGGRDASVLICDDDEGIRRLITVIVNRASQLHVVGEARNGTEAILEAARLKPDVIVLDLAMPRRSGLDALPELRRVAPDARIVVLSGFSAEIAAADVLRLGAAAYLEKGISPDEIVAAIRAALDRPPEDG
jgi:DNA-binding NarL/FixJ family response regulator